MFPGKIEVRMVGAGHHAGSTGSRAQRAAGCDGGSPIDAVLPAYAPRSTRNEVQLLAAINTIGRLPCLEIRVRGDMLEYPAGSGRLVRSGETVTVDGPFAAWRICLRMRQRRWPGFEPTDPQLLAYWAAFIAYTDR